MASLSKFELLKAEPSAILNRSFVLDSDFADSIPVSNIRVAYSASPVFDATQPMMKNASGRCDARLTASRTASEVIEPMRSAFWIMA